MVSPGSTSEPEAGFADLVSWTFAGLLIGVMTAFDPIPGASARSSDMTLVFVTEVNVVGDALTVVRKVSGGVSSTLLDVAGAQDAAGEVPLAPTANVKVPNVDEVETPVQVQVNVNATFAAAGALVGLTVHAGVVVFDPVVVTLIVPGVTEPTATLDVRVCFSVIVAGLPAEPVTSTGASKEFVFVGPCSGGTHASLLPADVGVLIVGASTVHVFNAML